jgi:hypothetical protein
MTSSTYSAEMQDRMQVLFQQEATFYMTNDYLGTLLQQHKAAPDDMSGTSKILNQHWRQVMCEWAYHGKSRAVCGVASNNEGFQHLTNDDDDCYYAKWWITLTFRATLSVLA